MQNVSMTRVLNDGGKVYDVYKPPNQEIKVKQSLSGIIKLKH